MPLFTFSAYTEYPKIILKYMIFNLHYWEFKKLLIIFGIALIAIFCAIVPNVPTVQLPNLLAISFVFSQVDGKRISSNS